MTYKVAIGSVRQHSVGLERLPGGIVLTEEGVPDLPTARADICLVLVTAPDNSSYNIFMIAGLRKSDLHGINSSDC